MPFITTDSNTGKSFCSSLESITHTQNYIFYLLVQIVILDVSLWNLITKWGVAYRVIVER